MHIYGREFTKIMCPVAGYSEIEDSEVEIPKAYDRIFKAVRPGQDRSHYPAAIKAIKAELLLLAECFDFIEASLVEELIEGSLELLKHLEYNPHLYPEDDRVILAFLDYLTSTDWEIYPFTDINRFDVLVLLFDRCVIRVISDDCRIRYSRERCRDTYKYPDPALSFSRWSETDIREFNESICRRFGGDD